jgi:hypothetical protein
LLPARPRSDNRQPAWNLKSAWHTLVERTGVAPVLESNGLSVWTATTRDDDTCDAVARSASILWDAKDTHEADDRDNLDAGEPELAFSVGPGASHVDSRDDHEGHSDPYAVRDVRNPEIDQQCRSRQFGGWPKSSEVRR